MQNILSKLELELYYNLNQRLTLVVNLEMFVNKQF